LSRDDLSRGQISRPKNKNEVKKKTKVVKRARK